MARRFDRDKGDAKVSFGGSRLLHLEDFGFFIMYVTSYRARATRSLISRRMKLSFDNRFRCISLESPRLPFFVRCSFYRGTIRQVEGVAEISQSVPRFPDEANRLITPAQVCHD